MISISILQEYEKIKELIGEDRWNNIDSYIKENPELTFDKLIYNMFNWIKFDRWYNKEIKKQEVEILGTWGTDYGNIACQAILYKNGKKVANIMDSDEETTIRYVYGDSHSELTEELVKASFESLINNDFDKYLELPKISECSNLLQEIYDFVCVSEASMCHIDDIDWMYWKDTFDFKDEDIDELEKEIKKYGLEEVIGIGDSGYKIVGYGNLQYMFNDDRNITKDYVLDENNKLEILKTCKDYHILKSNLKYEFLEEMENRLQHYLNYISKNDNIDDYKKEHGNHDIVDWFEGMLNTKDFLRYNIKNKINKNIREGMSLESYEELNLKEVKKNYDYGDRCLLDYLEKFIPVHPNDELRKLYIDVSAYNEIYANGWTINTLFEMGKEDEYWEKRALNFIKQYNVKESEYDEYSDFFDKYTELRDSLLDRLGIDTSILDMDINRIPEKGFMDGEIIESCNELDEEHSYTVARVLNMCHCVELHYNEGKATIEYGTKLAPDYWEA